MSSHVAPSGSRPTRKRASVTTTPECGHMHIPTMQLNGHLTYYLVSCKATNKLLVSPTGANKACMHTPGMAGE
jgi:hypothetical protein